tara:strand:+ start:5430 stop:6488 length:1059 start_codon:yes stop_codon:yes gene_type:complete
MDKSEQEHKYSSTGIKFWRHRKAMEMYQYPVEGHSIISTHISPEGACNLKCPYCAVTHRTTHDRIELDVIKDYVNKLIPRGLKAVILTGGGEPTAYKYFNDLVRWLHWQGLSVALITNGTLTHKVDPVVWKMFSWIRVSINMFEGWQNRILLPVDEIPETTTKGCSFVFTKHHELGEYNLTYAGYIDNYFKDISKVADQCGAEYIRVLPDCLLPQNDLEQHHYLLDTVLAQAQVNDPRFFHQNKNHETPQCGTCHQAYFRPYLSEQDGGTVYPCDSVVLNDGAAVFMKEYAICKPDEILDFLDGKIPMKFNPIEDCKGCVFTENINMLDNWRNGAEGRFHEFSEKLTHEEFV